MKRHITTSLTMKRLLLLFVFIASATCELWAYDFSYTHSGTTLYYNITSTSPRTVEVEAPIGTSGSVIIPSSVIYNGNRYSVINIRYGAFIGCPDLSSVTIPNSVTSIEEYAFEYCSNLTSVHMKGTTPPRIYNQTFSNTNPDISVPCSALSAYQNSPYWNRLNLIAKFPTVLVNSSNNSYGTVSILSCSCTAATIQASANTGCRFLRWSDNDTHSLRSLTLSAYDNLNLTAYFESLPGWYDIIVQPANSNQGSVSGGGHLQGNTTATLTATPNSGYQFVRWSDGSDDNPYSILVTGDATYTAHFVRSTGITDAETDGVVITARDGMIVCYGCQGKIVAIYDQIGRTILPPCRHTEDHLACPINHAGIYIVRIDNTTSHKVLVR